jgi:hypothetical protein
VAPGVLGNFILEQGFDFNWGARYSVCWPVDLRVEILEPWVAQDKFNSTESGDVEAFFDLFISAAHH